MSSLCTQGHLQLFTVKGNRRSRSEVTAPPPYHLNMSPLCPTQDDCVVDVANLILNVLFIVLSTIIAILAFEDKITQRVRLREHNARWIVLICLLVTNLAEICDSYLIPSGKLQTFSYPAPSLVNFVALIFVSIFYDLVEKYNEPKPLLILLFYWPFIIISKIFKLAQLFHLQLDLHHVSMTITLTYLVLYLLILGLEVNLLWSYKYLTDGNEIQFFHDPPHTFPSVATFAWIFDLIFKERKKIISSKKLEKKIKGYQVKENLDKFKEIYSNESWKNDSLHLWRSLIKFLWRPLMLAAFFKFISDLLAVLLPLTVGVMVNYTTINYLKVHKATVSDFFKNGFVMASILFVASILNILFHNHFLRVIYTLKIRLKSILQVTILNKILKTSVNSNQKSLDLFTQDVNEIVTFSHVFLFISSYFFKIFLLSIFLYIQIGWSVFIGITIPLFLSFPVHFYIQKLRLRNENEAKILRSRRVNRIRELMIKITALKMNLWEGTFVREVHRLYERETRNLCVTSVYWWIHDGFSWITFVFMCTVGFGIRSSTDSLSPATTFTALALFFQVFLTLFTTPLLISVTFNTITSAKRLRTFLTALELCNDQFRHRENEGSTVLEFEADSGSIVLNIRDNVENRRDTAIFLSESDDEGILEEGVTVELKEASFSLNSTENEEILKNISLTIYSGKITLIKSLSGNCDRSLGLALLGELNLLSGSINWRTKNSFVAWVPRTPWLLRGSVRENILFGIPYDAQRYNRVIAACGLQEESNNWSSADLTLVDDLLLSIDQKQRISIARALYSECKTIFIENVLDFVDPQMILRIFDEGFRKLALYYKRTVLLTSNSQEFLPLVDRVILLEDGSVKFDGDRKEIEANELDLLSKRSQSSVVIPDNVYFCSSGSNNLHLDYFSPVILSWMGLWSLLSWLKSSEEDERNWWKEKKNTQIEEFNDESEHENSSIDVTRAMIKPKIKDKKPITMKLRTILMKFLSAIGLIWSAFLFFTLITTIFLFVGRDIWLYSWVDKQYQALDDSSGLPVYVTLSLLTILCLCFLGVVASIAASKAWSSLHSLFVNSLAKSSLGSLTLNTTQKVVEFFNLDFARLQNSFPVFVYQTWFLLFFITVVFISIAVSSYFVFGFGLLILSRRFIQKAFDDFRKQIENLYTSTSQIIECHVSDVLKGVVLIRSLGQERSMIEKLCNLIENNNLMSLGMISSHLWYSFYSNIFSLIYMWSVCLMAISGGVNGDFSPAFVGFAIVYVLMLPVSLDWTMFLYPQFISDATAIEKIDFLSDILAEKDDDTDVKLDSSLDNWPNQGMIRLNDVTFPPFNSITLEINAGEKVGIFVTEDASQIPLLFLRMIKISPDKIFIDDIDITRIPRSILLQRICVITNDVDIFEGPIRVNLDMKNNFSDEDLWSALETLHLKDTIESLPDGLNTPISPESTLLTTRDIKLLDLTRAFLRRPKIFITYNVESWLLKILFEIFPDNSMLCLSNELSSLSGTKNGEIVDGTFIPFYN